MAAVGQKCTAFTENLSPFPVGRDPAVHVPSCKRLSYAHARLHFVGTFEPPSRNSSRRTLKKAHFYAPTRKIQKNSPSRCHPHRFRRANSAELSEQRHRFELVSLRKSGIYGCFCINYRKIFYIFLRKRHVVNISTSSVKQSRFFYNFCVTFYLKKFG